MLLGLGPLAVAVVARVPILVEGAREGCAATATGKSVVGVGLFRRAGIGCFVAFFDGPGKGRIRVPVKLPVAQLADVEVGLSGFAFSVVPGLAGFEALEPDGLWVVSRGVASSKHMSGLLTSSHQVLQGRDRRGLGFCRG